MVLSTLLLWDLLFFVYYYYLFYFIFLFFSFYYYYYFIFFIDRSIPSFLACCYNREAVTCWAVVSHSNKPRHSYEYFSGGAMEYPLGQTIWYIILCQKAKSDFIWYLFFLVLQWSSVHMRGQGSVLWRRWSLSFQVISLSDLPMINSWALFSPTVP